MQVPLAFYRTLAVPLVGISVICVLQVLLSHSAYFVFTVFWEKVLTSIVICTYIIIFRADQFIFYNNLGYSRTRLLLMTFGFDFLFWLVSMILTVKLL